MAKTDRYDLIYAFCGITPRALMEQYPDKKFTLESAEEFLHEHEQDLFIAMREATARMIIALSDDTISEAFINAVPTMSALAH